jgi:hypothetical protein
MKEIQKEFSEQYRLCYYSTFQNEFDEALRALKNINGLYRKYGTHHAYLSQTGRLNLILIYAEEMVSKSINYAL